MESRNKKQPTNLRRRMKRRSVEIAVASILTLAALAYLGVTLMRTGNPVADNSVVSKTTTDAQEQSGEKR